LAHLKEVSKAKHHILEQYFPTWAKILGPYYRLVYVDCFAGEGKYNHDQLGSPVITLRLANKLAQQNGIQITLVYVEKDKNKSQHLEENLSQEGELSKGVNFYLFQ